MLSAFRQILADVLAFGSWLMVFDLRGLAGNYDECPDQL